MPEEYGLKRMPANWVRLSVNERDDASTGHLSMFLVDGSICLVSISMPSRL